MEYRHEGQIYSSEEQMQAICYQWYWGSFVPLRRLLFHVQQKAKNRIEGARFKAMGVTKGISDFIWITSRLHCIELKLPGEVQSDEQIEFMDKVRALGHIYVIVYSPEEFKAYIRKHLHECKVLM